MTRTTGRSATSWSTASEARDLSDPARTPSMIGPVGRAMRSRPDRTTPAGDPPLLARVIETLERPHRRAPRRPRRMHRGQTRIPPELDPARRVQELLRRPPAR